MILHWTWSKGQVRRTNEAIETCLDLCRSLKKEGREKEADVLSAAAQLILDLLSEDQGDE